MSPADLDPEDLDALAELSDDELVALHEPAEPDDPLAGYARPATRAHRQIDPRRNVRDLHPL